MPSTGGGDSTDVPRPARQIVHVDMDAFFASVEQRDDPGLVGKPVLVGGRSQRSVVAAASYEARVFGVRSAMPMAEAMRRCPEAVIVVPRLPRYREISRVVFGIFRAYTPLVEGLSLDEAFLDVTQSRGLFGDGETIAKRIKTDIRRELGLSASAGVAPCKFAAKVASAFSKPDGLTVVGADVKAFLAPLPVARMWGIGPKTTPTLVRLGYRTIGDLARAEVSSLTRVLGQRAEHVHALANGTDTREVEPDLDPRSIGAECTYERDLTEEGEIARTLFVHASRVAARLNELRLVAGAVVVKVKYADFTLLTRRMTLEVPASDTQTIHAACLGLLERFPLRGAAVRLTGVAAHDLTDARAVQRSLFPDRDAERRRDVESLRLSVKGRFGVDALTFATLLDESAPDTRGEHDDGPEPHRDTSHTEGAKAAWRGKRPPRP